MTHGNNRGRESSTGRQAFPTASAHISSSPSSTSSSSSSFSSCTTASYAVDLLVVDSEGSLCCNLIYSVLIGRFYSVVTYFRFIFILVFR